MTRSVRYQPILHTLYYTLHTEQAYCLSYRFLNNVVTTTVVEMVEILDGRLGKHSVELVRYVINNLLHFVIVKYGDISLVLCISTRLRLVTIIVATREISRHNIPPNTFTPIEERVLNTIKYYPRSLDFMMIKSLP